MHVDNVKKNLHYHKLTGIFQKLGLHAKIITNFLMIILLYSTQICYTYKISTYVYLKEKKKHLQSLLAMLMFRLLLCKWI